MIHSFEPRMLAMKSLSEPTRLATKAVYKPSDEKSIVYMFGWVKNGKEKKGREGLFGRNIAKQEGGQWESALAESQSVQTRPPGE